MILEHFLLKLHHWSALRVQSIPIGVKSILKKYYYISFFWEMWASCEVFWYGGEICYSKWAGPLWTWTWWAGPSLWSTNTWALFFWALVRVGMGELEFFVEDWNILFSIAWHTHQSVSNPCCSPTFGWRWRRKDKSSKRQSCVHVIMSVPPPLQKRARHQVKSTRSSISQTDPLLI